jgi:arylsulfatase A-like enzyme
MRRALIALILLAAAAWGIWKFFEVPARARVPQYNVLYLNADSFNRRHIQIYGYHRKTMPFVETLARKGVVFDRMINPSGWTNENLVSIFSSLSSPVHRVECRNLNIDPAWVTPLEIIRDYGYTMPRLEGWQMDQNHAELGFEALENVHPAEWLEKHGREGPFFLFHQFLTPHLPYNGDRRDTEIFSRFLSPDMYASAEQRRRIDATVYSQTVIKNDGHVVFESGDSAAIHALYDGELAVLDHEIERTVKTLEKLGLAENTIIVIGADHGEELLEHGFVGHASTSRNGHLFDEIVNVPFLVCFPKKIAPGRVIHTQVRGIDVLPTILELLEIPVPEYLEGRSLMPVLRGEEAEDRIAFIQTSRAGYGEADPLNVTDRIRAVRTPEWKLVHYDYQENQTRFELYRLAEDPDEQRNVIDSFPREANELRRKLVEWLIDREEAKPPPPDAFVRKSLYQKLRDRWFPRRRRTDFAGVPSPPEILSPHDRDIVTSKTMDRMAAIRWTGEADVPYVIEYDVGTGDYALNGLVEVEGNEKVFGPFTEKYWNTYLTLYTPYRVRVSIDKEPRDWSSWVRFEVKPAAADTP